MEKISGKIEKFIFHNEENGYSIIRLEDDVIAVGLLLGVNEGEEIELEGQWVNHPKYGVQFKFESYNVVYPSSKEGIIGYLSSDLISGIGPSLAERIVNRFGENTFSILDNEIERLTEVEGIGKKKLALIKSSWNEHKAYKEIFIFLQKYSISVSMAIKIIKKYGANTIFQVESNPYQLTYDIRGIGFKIADKIALSLGFNEDDPRRIAACIFYVLNEASTNGHTYLPKENVIEEVEKFVDYKLDFDDYIFKELSIRDKIIIKNDKVFLPYLYFAERYIEKKIMELLNSPSQFSEKQIKNLRINKESFSEEQIEAIKLSLLNKILILTGGPGTGKTTAIKGIISIYADLEKEIALAAPTGRAAKRISEVTGLEAKTIHRLLEYNPTEEMFNYNEDNKLECDLLIVDESSMIDSVLMFHLLKAISTKTTVIFVGDVDQLPSVGPGNILKDLINYEKLNVVTLTKIFRQAAESKIITNAHKINHGEFPEIINGKDDDFFFMEFDNPMEIQNTIIDLVTERLPKAYDINPLTDVQILAPMYKGECGVNQLNHLLQDSLNHNQALLTRGETRYKLGDKVMQLVNNYDKDVYNGDIGFISEINIKEKYLRVDYGSKAVKYEFSLLEEITHAYAITVHKSQGSEYPVVIMPLHSQHFIMLQRNLIYTAITRASKLFIFVGQKKSLFIAINNNKTRNRFTSLFKEEFND